MFRPLADRLLIQRAAPPEKHGSIYVADNAKEKPTEGTVLAAGPGRTTDDGTVVPMAVKVGDRVLFGKYTGDAVKVDGEEQVVIREGDVLGVIVE